MIKRINYTGRHKIHRDDTQFLINSDQSNQISFDAKLNFDNYKLPSNAKVCVEAYRQTSWMRFDYGSVDNITQPTDRSLSQFNSAEGILFRVKITSGDKPTGILIAEADKIPLRRPDDQFENCTPLLPVIPKKLSGQISRIDFEGQPRLEINTEVGDWRQLTREPAFMSLVLSYAVRDILTRILFIEEYNETSDPDDWRSQWLQFVTQLSGVTDIEREEKDDYDDWIENAVSAFGRSHGTVNMFLEFWNKEVSA